MITLSTQPRPTAVPAVASADARAASVGAVAHASGRNAGPMLVSVREGLWRVVDRTGVVLGHIERQAQAEGDRYLARRIVLPSRRMDLGAFWRIDEAADCFR